MTTPALERLAQLVHARRTELRLGVEPAAKVGGISKDTWKRVEAGQKVWDRSFAGIEKALQWEPGSCARILNGDAPVVAGSTQASRADAASDARDAVQLALIATAKGTTADEIREMSERVVQELRERGLI
jgi:hypothetical protein